MDKVAPISEIRAHLPEVVDEVNKKQKRFMITRQGKSVAFVVSPEFMETFEIMRDSDLIKSLIRAEHDLKEGRLHRHEDVFHV